MKKQITIVGKYELSKEDVIRYINEGLQREENVTATSFVFEPTLSRVIVTVKQEQNETIVDPYHKAPKRTIKSATGVVRPNYGVSMAIRDFIIDLIRFNKSEIVEFTFHDIFTVLSEDFGELKPEVLKRYLRRTDMLKHAMIEVVGTVVNGQSSYTASALGFHLNEKEKRNSQSR